MFLREIGPKFLLKWLITDCSSFRWLDQHSYYGDAALKIMFKLQKKAIEEQKEETLQSDTDRDQDNESVLLQALYKSYLYVKKIMMKS